MKLTLAALLLALAAAVSAQEPEIQPVTNTPATGASAANPFAAAFGSTPIAPSVEKTTPLNDLPLNDPLLSSRGSWDQSYGDQWGLSHIGLVSEEGIPSAAFPEQLKPVIVALIDSGVDYSHPDLPVEQLWRNPDERANGRDDDGNGLIDDLIGWNFVARSNSPWDDHGHGTHIAGIIAAGRDNGIGISGIAPNARLMVLKVVDASGHASGSHIAQAVRYATDKGARLIHLSLGGQEPGAVELDAINYALDREVVVITAAGNQARGDSDRGYEQLERVLVVGAVTPDGQRALFSDWGPALDLVAPGVNVLSLRAQGSDFLRRNGVAGYTPASAIVQQHYYRATGTSFAAPHVTGLAALILGRDPWLKPPQLQRMLLHSARDLGPRGIDQNHGYGLLDAEAALKASPEHFVEARLQRAELNAAQQLVVVGTTDADSFFQAQVDYGMGEAPQSWQPLLAQPISQPLRNQPLLSLDANSLPKGQLMTLRLITEHRDGSTRESRLQLQLPGGAP
ncbi:MAG: S8 family peptidase [Motiliproteus sp.]